MKKSNQSKRKHHLHRRILLHPAYMFAVLCAGILVSAASILTSAETYGVHAVVPAPVVTVGAVITFPADNAVVVNAPLEVIGSCEIGSSVALQRNGNFSGSSLCSSTGTFSIITDLALGDNSLQAQAYSRTNEAGPVTGSITITYKPEVSAPTPSTTTDTTTSKVAITAANAPAPADIPKDNNYDVTDFGALQLDGHYAYQERAVGSSFSWGLNLHGGQPPYKVNVSWGDGQSSKYYFTEDPAFTISHKYAKPGDYTVIADSVDAKNYKVHLQLAAHIRSSSDPVVATSTTPTSTGGILQGKVNSNLLLKILWPSYFTVLLMSVSYWLGQHRELEVLRKQAVRHHRKRPA